MERLELQVASTSGLTTVNAENVEIPDKNYYSAYVTVHYPDDAIPVGAEIDLQTTDTENKQNVNYCNHELDILTYQDSPMEIPDVMETDSGINLSLPQDMLQHIADEDLEIASVAGIIKWPRFRPQDKAKITPNRKLMRTLLRHIYEVTGQVYEDIPTKFRTSHISLALYLKNCIKYGKGDPLIND